jgi:iron complex transport system substrate-binding protein
MSVIAVATMVLASACGGDDAPAVALNSATPSESVEPSTPLDPAAASPATTETFDETRLDGFPALAKPTKMFEIVGRTDTTVTVEHAYGQVEIPTRPKRVVAYGPSESLISLGFDPIAYPSFRDMAPPMRAQSPDTEWLEITDTAPNLEALAALKPDLIIESEPWAGGRGEKANYERVSKIAPTLVLPLPSNYWIDEIRQFGELFELTDEAEQVIADFNARISALRERARAAIGDETVALVLLFGLDVWLSKPAAVIDGQTVVGVSSSWLHQELGLTPAVDVFEAFEDDPTSELTAISAEFLPDLKADHLVVLPGNYSGESDIDTGYDAFVKSTIWQAIPAVANGNVHEIGEAFIPLGYYTKLDILEKFVEAIEQ